MHATEFGQLRQFFRRENGTVLANESAVESALSANSEAAFHVSFDGKLRGNIFRIRLAHDGDQHRFGAASKNG